MDTLYNFLGHGIVHQWNHVGWHSDVIFVLVGMVMLMSCVHVNWHSDILVSIALWLNRPSAARWPLLRVLPLLHGRADQNIRPGL